MLTSCLNLTTSSFPSNRQHLAESDKVLVCFPFTLKTAMLAAGLWAIKITNLTVGAKTFRQGSSRHRFPAYLKIC